MMATDGLPEVPNTQLLPFQSEMTWGERNNDQGWAVAHRRVGDAGAICGSAESDLLLHEDGWVLRGGANYS
jgi:hypothetical protein